MGGHRGWLHDRGATLELDSFVVIRNPSPLPAFFKKKMQSEMLFLADAALRSIGEASSAPVIGR